MLYTTCDGRKFDTDKDLAAPERHILQKLFLWETLCESLDQFRQKKREAMLKGWGNSGPVEEGPVMRIILRDLEKKILKRLAASE